MSTEVKEVEWNDDEAVVRAAAPECFANGGGIRHKDYLWDDWRSARKNDPAVVAFEREHNPAYDKPFLPPLGDRSHHFETEAIIQAIGGRRNDYTAQKIEQKLHAMTSGERYTLFRAIKKLVLTTPLPEEAEREAFEKWAQNSLIRLPLRKVIDDRRYESMETEWAWQAWQARAAMKEGA